MVSLVSVRPMEGAEQPVSDGIGDVEVALLHQVRIVVVQVQLPKSIYARDSPPGGVILTMIDKVQQLVIQEVRKPGDGEQKPDVWRDQPGKKQCYGSTRTDQEEQDQNRGEQHRLEVAAAIERHVLVGKEAMMLFGVALVDDPQSRARMMHRPAMSEVLREVSV